MIAINVLFSMIDDVHFDEFGDDQTMMIRMSNDDIQMRDQQ